MRKRPPTNSTRGRIDLRLDTDLIDELDAMANVHTFGNKSALIERILTDAVAASGAAA